jgi:hypothetical protein
VLLVLLTAPIFVLWQAMFLNSAPQSLAPLVSAVVLFVAYVIVVCTLPAPEVPAAFLSSLSRQFVFISLGSLDTCGVWHLLHGKRW